MAARRVMRPTSIVAAAIMVLTFSNGTDAAPIVWEFSGQTVAQTPICSSFLLPCPSSTVFAVEGTVSFDPVSNQVFSMFAAVDFNNSQFTGGVGSILYGQTPFLGIPNSSEVRLVSGDLRLRLGLYPLGFAGPLAEPLPCGPVDPVFEPVTSSCVLEILDSAGGLRLVAADITSVHAVPEPATVLLIAAGLAASFRTARRM